MVQLENELGTKPQGKLMKKEEWMEWIKAILGTLLLAVLFVCLWTTAAVL